jgi:hypothetical protein
MTLKNNQGFGPIVLHREDDDDLFDEGSQISRQSKANQDDSDDQS